MLGGAPAVAAVAVAAAVAAAAGGGVGLVMMLQPVVGAALELLPPAPCTVMLPPLPSRSAGGSKLIEVLALGWGCDCIGCRACKHGHGGVVR